MFGFIKKQNVNILFSIILSLLFLIYLTITYSVIINFQYKIFITENQRIIDNFSSKLYRISEDAIFF